MKKLVIACMVMLLFLAVVGLSTAGWAETIFINRKTETGVLRVGIRSRAVNDYGRDPIWFEGPNPENLDIGSVSCTGGRVLFVTGGDRYSEKVVVNIRGYPSYAPECTVEVVNGGTIPAKLNSLECTWYGDLAGDVQLGRWTLDFPGEFRKRGRGLASLEKTIEDTSMDPGQKLWIEMQFRVGGKWTEPESPPQVPATSEGKGKDMRCPVQRVECGIAACTMNITYRQWNIPGP